MISIVIPLFNEEESLQILYKQIVEVIPQLDKAYEIIFIDDGSKDTSLEILKSISKKDKHVRVFSFRKNHGKAEGLSFGFLKAKGEYIVTLDADLQDKPLEIPKVLQRAREEWDVVCGWRKNRQDALKKKISSKIFNKLVKFFWGLDLHDYNCGLKVYTQEAAKNLHLYGGMHRFIPILAYKQGFSVTEVPVEHERRKFGKSKYGFSKIWKDIPDIFTMLFLTKYSDRPLHFFGTIGIVFVFLGILVLSYLSIVWFQGYSIGRRPLLFFGMLLVLSGFQIFFTGFLADFILNVSQKKEKTLPIKFTTDPL